MGSLKSEPLMEMESVIPWICRIHRISAVYMGREMANMGFGPGQFFFLAELYVEDGISQDELSRRVGVDKSNTSRALAKLEQYGLIRKETDPENHRIKKVYLEPKAHEIQKRFVHVQKKWNAKLMAGICEKDQAALLAHLKKIADNSDSFYTGDSPESGAEKNEHWPVEIRRQAKWL